MKKNKGPRFSHAIPNNTKSEFQYNEDGSIKITSSPLRKFTEEQEKIMKEYPSTSLGESLEQRIKNIETLISFGFISKKDGMGLLNYKEKTVLYLNKLKKWLKIKK